MVLASLFNRLACVNSRLVSDPRRRRVGLARGVRAPSVGSGTEIQRQTSAAEGRVGFETEDGVARSGGEEEPADLHLDPTAREAIRGHEEVLQRHHAQRAQPDQHAQGT